MPRTLLLVAPSLLASLAFASSLLGQEPLGRVQGVVADTAGSPLEGADIAIGSRSTRTSARGTFLLDSVPLGKHVLVARFLGHTPARVPITVVAGKPVELFIRLLPAAYALPEVTVEATRTGIFGLVVDPALNPVAGARVQILGTGGKDFLTDSTGTFSFPTTRTEPYLVRVTASGYGEQHTLVEVKRGQGRQVHFRLTYSRQIPSRIDEVALADLGRRLATGFRAERLTSAQLERYETLGLCDLPYIREKLRESGGKSTNLILNGTTLIKDFPIVSLCTWRANEVDLVELGPEYCWEVTMTIAYLVQPGVVRCPNIRRPMPGHSYVLLWDQR